jgi:hypothetical protein
VGTWAGDLVCGRVVSKMQWNITSQTPDGVLDGNGSVPSTQTMFPLRGSRIAGNKIEMRGYKDLTVAGNTIKGSWLGQGGTHQGTSPTCDVVMRRQ